MELSFSHPSPRPKLSLSHGQTKTRKGLHIVPTRRLICLLFSKRSIEIMFFNVCKEVSISRSHLETRD